MSYVVGGKAPLHMDALTSGSDRSSDSSVDEVLTFSPDRGLSPVTSLSGNMGHLHCADSVSPRRKLKLSPDSTNSSRSETPTPHVAMATASVSVFPSEATPPPASSKSDSSGGSGIHKALKKKAARRVNVREDGENASQPDITKKKSRMKLSDLFHSPELVVKQRCDKPGGGKHMGNATRRRNRVTPQDTRLTMTSDVSPTFNGADTEDDDLIGDFSKQYCLPVEKGKHQDLKYISSNTLAHLLRGGYKDTIEKYCVVDCRYPYEYAGGHIKGAWNLYRQEEIADYFLKMPSLPQIRTVLVFHCEFSSERAPKLCRALRNMDRKENVYPHLYYPELYLLQGGYREFYENFTDLCEPQGYVNMLHRDFRDQLQKYHKNKKLASGQRVRKELFKPLTSSPGFSPVTTQSLSKHSLQ
ncbi:M-phase inducer phosphatase 1-A-like [Hyperolius riggenbachi]|uniref:M-phase inducer phosphatase 1-A-like n=1 Tax=Hyperolius riggenbachi TaxID=752182 RepID=UPI0035A38197